MKALYSVVALLLFTGIASANVTVNGQGKVSYVPDLGYVTVGVSSKGATAEEAWAKNNAAIKKLFEVLKAHGIDPKDYQTSNLNVTPEYSRPENEELRGHIVGYVVSYDLRITVRKLDDMGALLDDMVKNGANRNVSISFGLADTEKLMDEARIKAIADARRKAELYAKAAGTNLGKVISISEVQMGYPQPLQMEFRDTKSFAVGLQLAQGQQELSVSITVVYGFDGGKKELQPEMPDDRMPHHRFPFERGPFDRYPIDRPQFELCPEVFPAVL
jgi:uncharacterized protein YggE